MQTMGVMMKTKNLKNKALYIMAITASLFLLMFMVAATWIGFEVQSSCQNAQKQYGGDCVEALIQVMDNPDHSFREKNNAVWALGQVGDTRALATLEKYYTGDIPKRESLDKVLSQYELKKAINLLKGGVNVAGMIWRIARW